MNTDIKQVSSIEVIPLIFFLQEVEKAPGPSTWDMKFTKQKLEEMKILFKIFKSTDSLINWKGDDIKEDIESTLEISNGVNSYSLGIFDGIGATFILKEPGVVGIDLLLGMYYLLAGSKLNVDAMLPKDKSDTANIEFDKLFDFIITSIRSVLSNLKLLEETESE